MGAGRRQVSHSCLFSYVQKAKSWLPRAAELSPSAVGCSSVFNINTGLFPTWYVLREALFLLGF